MPRWFFYPLEGRFLSGLIFTHSAVKPSSQPSSEGRPDEGQTSAEEKVGFVLCRWTESEEHSVRLRHEAEPDRLGN